MLWKEVHPFYNIKHLNSYTGLNLSYWVKYKPDPDGSNGDIYYLDDKAQKEIESSGLLKHVTKEDLLTQRSEASQISRRLNQKFEDSISPFEIQYIIKFSPKAYELIYVPRLRKMYFSFSEGMF